MAVAPGAGVGLGSWNISEDLVHRYLDAVDNPRSISLDLKLAPPLALSAWALASMLDSLDLPPGAIHSRQELQSHRAITFGETLQVAARIGKLVQRAGLTMLTAGYALTDAAGQTVQEGKTTVLTATPGTDRDTSGPGRQPQSEIDTPPPDQDSLPAVRLTVTQPRLDAYAAASGDNNPLHLDAEFAATTQFRGIIAHGMLTLASISEMMERAFGQPWLESGSLNVRFKGAAYVGDQLESFGKIIRTTGTGTSCAVGVKSLSSGQDLITGTAATALP